MHTNMLPPPQGGGQISRHPLLNKAFSAPQAPIFLLKNWTHFSWKTCFKYAFFVTSRLNNILLSMQSENQRKHKLKTFIIFIIILNQKRPFYG